MLNAAQLEIAAREYCKLKGLDPEEEVGHGADTDDYTGGAVPAIWLYSPRWQRVARFINEHAFLNHCIDHALGSTVKQDVVAVGRYNFAGRMNQD